MIFLVTVPLADLMSSADACLLYTANNVESMANTVGMCWDR